jgi:hypothetical protein
MPNVDNLSLQNENGEPATNPINAIIEEKQK